MVRKLVPRWDTAANWLLYDTVLLEGEFGYEFITLKYKIGDGVSTWSTLPYATFPGTLYLGETNTTAYRGDRGKIAYDHSTKIAIQDPHGYNTILSTKVDKVTGKGVVAERSQIFVPIDGNKLFTVTKFTLGRYLAVVGDSLMTSNTNVSGQVIEYPGAEDGVELIILNLD